MSGMVGIDGATVAAWDETVLPISYRLVFGDSEPQPPYAIVATVADDIDGYVDVQEDGDDVVAVRVSFASDIDEMDQLWVEMATVHLPAGRLVLADHYRSPRPPYRQRLTVRPGRWLGEVCSEGENAGSSDDVGSADFHGRPSAAHA